MRKILILSLIVAALLLCASCGSADTGGSSDNSEENSDSDTSLSFWADVFNSSDTPPSQMPDDSPSAEASAAPFPEPGA